MIIQLVWDKTSDGIMSVGQCVPVCLCVSQRDGDPVREHAFVCVCIRTIIATVLAELEPMKTGIAMSSWLIHKMGSGVQIVKWLLCGFHMQS